MDISIEFEDKNGGGWSTDTMTVLRGRGKFHFEIDEPWAGDTESGFGQTCDLNLTDEQARSLLAFLQHHLAVENAG